MKRRARSSGFTLIELLISSAILAILGVAGYMGLDVVLGTAERTSVETERLHQIQRGFTQIAMDLEQATGRPIRDGLGDAAAAMVYDASTESLEFTRGGLPNPAGWSRSSLQRVAYVVEQEKLVRTYWRELDRLQGAEPVRRLLLNGVDSFAFRFMDQQFEWHEQWPPLTSGSFPPDALPNAVELTVTLLDWGELRRVYALPR